jgi:hypothetical protein
MVPISTSAKSPSSPVSTFAGWTLDRELEQPVFYLDRKAEENVTKAGADERSVASTLSSQGASCGGMSRRPSKGTNKARHHSRPCNAGSGASRASLGSIRRRRNPRPSGINFDGITTKSTVGSFIRRMTTNRQGFSQEAVVTRSVFTCRTKCGRSLRRVWRRIAGDIPPLDKMVRRVPPE